MMRLQDFKVIYGLSDYCARQELSRLVKQGRIKVCLKNKKKLYKCIVEPLKAHDPFNLGGHK